MKARDWTLMKSGFWEKLKGWEELSPGIVEWKDGWLQNGFCGNCRLCCAPQGDDEPFPMPLLPSQVTDEISTNFYLLENGVPYIGKDGCKSLGCEGCRLSRREKPIACGLFPLVLVEGKLYLYQNCPAVLKTPLESFMRFARKAGEMLLKYTFEDLRTISIKMPCETLSSKYIDMHVRIFNREGMSLVLE